MRVGASARNAGKEMSMQTCSTRSIQKLRRFSLISKHNNMQQPQYLSSHSVTPRQKRIFEETTWQSHLSSQQNQRLPRGQPPPHHPKRKGLEQICWAHSPQLDRQQSLQTEKNQRTSPRRKDHRQNNQLPIQDPDRRRYPPKHSDDPRP